MSSIGSSGSYFFRRIDSAVFFLIISKKINAFTVNEVNQKKKKIKKNVDGGDDSYILR